MQFPDPKPFAYDKPMWAFYSEKARCEVGGVDEFELVDGSIVRATVAWSREDGEGYCWPDKVCLGKIRRYLRRVEKSLLPYCESYAWFTPDGRTTYTYRWVFP